MTVARMTVGSLFAGIGGFDLGFERAGFEIKWQVEIDPFCRAVLAKHWPDVRRYEDVRTVGAELERVDVIVGGFPCQDISEAGKQAGIDSGERSGLWREMARIIRELRPSYVVVENVTALLYHDMGIVLGDLATFGYDAEWESLPASRFGAPIHRDRVWIVAYPAQELRLRSVFPGHFNAEGDGQGFKRIWAMLSARRARGRPPANFLRIRADDGFSTRLDAIAGLGNAVIPQATRWIAERIKEAEAVAMRNASGY